MYRVYLIDAEVFPLCEDVGIEAEVLKGIADVTLVRTADESVLPDSVCDADAVIISHFPQISAAALRRFRRLRILVRNGVGFDNVDIVAARELGIAVCNVPDYGTEEVADHTLALTLALQRNVFPALQDVRKGAWQWRIAESSRRLRGQRFGIVGAGRIGTATALRAKAFGFVVQFFDPYVPSGYEKALGVDRCRSLNDLLSTSEVVSLHCPLSDETRSLIGRVELEQMKRGSFLINTARGPVIREHDLLAALRSGHLAGVALDVVEREPAFDAQLLEFPNCLLTPHIAFYSQQAIVDMRTSSARNIADTLRGGSPINVVNHVTLKG
ncbi:MAG: C-terminal binding protein [Bryobacteraceae bacterium]